VFSMFMGWFRHKVSQVYSPADENAGSSTPFEMTMRTSDALKVQTEPPPKRKLASSQQVFFVQSIFPR